MSGKRSEDANDIILEGTDGKPVRVSRFEFQRAVRDTFILGMNFPVLLAFRKAYLKRGGKLPITAESVEEVFKWDKK